MDWVGNRVGFNKNEGSSVRVIFVEPDCEGNLGSRIGDGNFAGDFEEIHGGSIVVSEIFRVNVEIRVG